MLKDNKYVCILSIAVMTLLYIMISMTAIFSMYIVHVCLGSGHNSYQGHVYDSGEFWRVLGCPCVRHHWKHNIVDTFTQHFCANGHWVDHRDQLPIYKEEWKMTLFPSAIHCISSCLSWLYFALQALLPLKPFYKVRDKPALLCIMLCNRSKLWKDYINTQASCHQVCKAQTHDVEFWPNGL